MADETPTMFVTENRERFNNWLFEVLAYSKKPQDLTNEQLSRFVETEYARNSSVIDYGEGTIISHSMLGNDIITLISRPCWVDSKNQTDYTVTFKSENHDSLTYANFTLRNDDNAYATTKEKVANFIDASIKAEEKQITNQLIAHAETLKYDQLGLDIQITSQGAKPYRFSRLCNDSAILLNTNNPDYQVLVENFPPSNSGKVGERQSGVNTFLVYKGEITHFNHSDSLDSFARYPTKPGLDLTTGEDRAKLPPRPLEHGAKALPTTAKLESEIIDQPALAERSSKELKAYNQADVVLPEERIEPIYAQEITNPKTGKIFLPTGKPEISSGLFADNLLKLAEAKIAEATPIPQITSGTPAPSASSANAPKPKVNFANFSGTQRELLAAAAAENNLNPDLFITKIQLESSGNPNAVSNTGCKGLGQFTDSTFLGVIKDHKLASKYPEVIWSRNNPVASALASSYYTAQILKAQTGKAPENLAEGYTHTREDYVKAYLGYNIGPTGAQVYMREHEKNPHAIIDPTITITYQGEIIKPLKGVTTNGGIYKVEDKANAPYKTYEQGLETIRGLFDIKKGEAARNPRMEEEVTNKHAASVETTKPDIPEPVLAQARQAVTRDRNQPPTPADPTKIAAVQVASAGASIA